METAWSKIKIGSFDELIKHEKEILERIAATPNGGNLYMIHPVMLLADVGVELSERSVKEILRHEPHLSGLSPAPYKALRATKQKQKVRFHIRGLFQRRAK